MWSADCILLKIDHEMIFSIDVRHRRQQNIPHISEMQVYGLMQHQEKANKIEHVQHQEKASKRECEVGQ
jgi:hypothetical protein